MILLLLLLFFEGVGHILCYSEIFFNADTGVKERKGTLENARGDQK